LIDSFIFAASTQFCNRGRAVIVLEVVRLCQAKIDIKAKIDIRTVYFLRYAKQASQFSATRLVPTDLKGKIGIRTV